MARTGNFGGFAFDEEVFTGMMQEADYWTTPIIASGIVQQDSSIMDLIGEHGNVATIPIYKPIDANESGMEALNNDGETNNTPVEISGDKQTCMLIAGGIGFLTWEDIKNHKWHFKKYRMQSKVIFMVTGILIFLPALYFFYFEFSNVPLTERVWVSLFQSVTPRTAGFNTADLTLLSEVGQMLIIMLMLIGGSPGSTAGGMKTTTLAVLVSSALSVFRKKEHTNFFGRQIPDDTIRNAATIFLMYIVLFLVGGMVISRTEDIPLMTALFETASAIGTVGLSLGITPDLGFVSHIILICLMFFGRVGGLTLIFATISEKKPNGSKYPQEKITVG